MWLLDTHEQYHLPSRMSPSLCADMAQSLNRTPHCSWPIAAAAKKCTVTMFSLCSNVESTTRLVLLTGMTL